MDLADVKPSIFNWAIVGLMAITFILFFKWFTTRFPIPGVSEVVQAV